MRSLWTYLNAEPSVDEILDDPIVRLLMCGDGTGENEVRRLVETVRVALNVDQASDEAPEAAPEMEPAAEAA
jgi:hypothetical protein